MRWQRATRARLLESRRRSDVGATLRESVNVYLDRPEVRALVGYRSRASALRAWVARIGPLTRSAITAARVSRILAEWLRDGYAPRTVHHRRIALMALYHALDGANAPTPCDRVASPID